MTSTPDIASPGLLAPALLSLIAQESVDCIKVLDLDARLLSMNETGQQTMEIDDLSVCENLLWPDFWQGEDRIQMEAALDRARAGQRSIFEGQAATFKGTPKWWEVRVAPVLDEHGAVQQLLAVSRDITARKQAELALVALNADLERQVAEQTQQTLQDAQGQAAFMAFVESVGTETDILALARQAIVVLCAYLSDASVGYYQPQNGRWVARAWSDDLPVYLVALITDGFPAEVPIFAQVLATRDAVFIDAWDADREGIPQSERYGTAGNYPLLLNGEVRGIFSVGLTQTRQWTKAGRALVRAVGRALNLAMERAEDLRQLTERGAALESLNGVLRRERTFLQAVLQSMSEGLVACDEQGQLILFNDVVCTFYGQDASLLPPEEWAGHYDLFEGDGVTPMTTARVPLYRAWQDEILRDVEMVIRPDQGPARHLLASGGPIFGEEGRPLGAMVTMRDVTGSKAAEQQLHHSYQQLERRNAELRAANEELEAFTYSASHDLRTPIRHVMGFAELAQNALGDTPNEKVSKYLDVVKQGALRMTDLIDGMLVLSRVGRQDLDSRLFDLERVVVQARQDVGMEFPGHAVRWQLGHLPQVRGESVMIQQVMTNLMSNAVKYSSTREVSEVRVWVTETAAEWVIRVQDNGVGFDLEYAEKLFGIFQRLHSQKVFQGTGVGLATVKRIVLKHGGQVFAESPDDSGAVFGFTLPKEG